MTLQMEIIATITTPSQSASITKIVIANATTGKNQNQTKKIKVPKELNAAELYKLMEKKAIKKGVVCKYCWCSPELCFCQKGENNDN